MAMNHGWRRCAEPPPSFEQRLSARDCDLTIGELVLSGDVARLFAPSGCDLPFDYNATLLLHDGSRTVVRVFKAAAGRETRLRDGWGKILDDYYNLMPGDVAVFTKSSQDRTFIACFLDANGNAHHSLLDAADDDPPSSPEFQVNADWFPALGAEAGWGAGGGDRALQVDDMTIKEAMDLAVECGAREGSDEHYMATKLFVKTENRAMFLTFRTNAGRLQWLRRCYEDWMN